MLQWWATYVESILTDSNVILGNFGGDRMRYNRKAQTLPDWFDLAKYDSLKSANTFEWYTQIVIRPRGRAHLGSREALSAALSQLPTQASRSYRSQQTPQLQTYDWEVPAVCRGRAN